MSELDEKLDRFIKSVDLRLGNNNNNILYFLHM